FWAARVSVGDERREAKTLRRCGQAQGRHCRCAGRRVRGEGCRRQVEKVFEAGVEDAAAVELDEAFDIFALHLRLGIYCDCECHVLEYWVRRCRGVYRFTPRWSGSYRSRLRWFLSLGNDVSLAI